MRQMLYLTRMYLQLAFGAVIASLSVVLFLVPANIAPAGVTGVSVILNFLFDTPVGALIFLLNIPIQIVGAIMLPGGWRNIVRVLFVIAIYSVAVDYLAPFVPADLTVDDQLLAAIFGGILGGIGGGIIIRAGGNVGGTGTIALIIQHRTGMPLSSIYLYTDTVVIIAAGYFFGINSALLAIVALFVDGLAANYIIEGPSVIRTALIVTDKPEIVSQTIMSELDRGMTGWTGKGMYTGEERTILYISISRSQVQNLRRVLQKADPHAFMVIGHGHTAYGQGFRKRMTSTFDLT